MVQHNPELRALMACVHHWDSPLQVGSQHLARCLLARGWRVAYVSAPITPLHLAKPCRDQLGRRFAIWKQGGERHHEGRLFAYVPAAPAAPDTRPLLRNSLLLRHWQRLSLPPVARLLSREGFGQVDLLYLDNFFHSFWLDAVTWRGSVYRMTDAHAGFPGHSKAMARVERELAARVDLVAYPSRTMAGLVDEMAPNKGCFLSNGVDMHRFAGPLPPCPEALADLAPPRLIFVGALERWVDTGLLAQVATACPQANLLCIGPRRGPLPELEALGNVRLTGELSRETTAACLRHAHLGLLPFDTQGYAELVAPLRPLKLFEYLAAGLPVISMNWPELAALRPPVRLCDDRDEFIRAVGTFVAGSEHPPRGGKAFAARYSWDTVCQELLEGVGLQQSQEAGSIGPAEAHAGSNRR